jgi:histidine ammonia-lyase
MYSSFYEPLHRIETDAVQAAHTKQSPQPLIAQVVLDGETCRTDDVYHIAHYPTQVQVAPACWERVRLSREMVNCMLARNEPIYGLNTGLGSLKKYALEPAELEAFNRDVILAHSVPLDTTPLSIPSVRAIMACRINGMVRGGSGVRPEIVQMLVDMLNLGVHPIVHGRSVSVGESDLSPMAEIGLVMIGDGRATYAGELLDGGEALRRAGLRPLTLHAKEALGLISANAHSTGCGALVVYELKQIMLGFEYATALAFEAFRANLNVLNPHTVAARKFAGQQISASNLRTLLHGSALFEAGTARNLQDPLSFRCAAQVLGTMRDTITYADQVITAMLNSSVDSPLTLPEEGTLNSTGNFESTSLALVFDHLRLALHRLILMSTQRLNKLLWHEFSDLPSALNDDPHSHRLGMLYNNISRSAAALTAYAQTTALPASLSYTPGITEGIDDYASMAPVALNRTWTMLWVAQRSIILELLVASRALTVLERQGRLHRLGTATAQIYAWLETLKLEHAFDQGAGSLEHLARDFQLTTLIQIGGLGHAYPK